MVHWLFCRKAVCIHVYCPMNVSSLSLSLSLSFSLVCQRCVENDCSLVELHGNVLSILSNACDSGSFTNANGFK